MKFCTLLFLLILFGLMLISCEGPAGPQGETGPEGPQGQTGDEGQQGVPGEDGNDGEDGQDGQDGNANVKLYIFDGHDFSATRDFQIVRHNLDTGYMSVWFVFLVHGEWYYPVSGYGVLGNTQYVAWHAFTTEGSLDVRIRRVDGPGELYDNILVVRIEAEQVAGKMAELGENSPADVDVSNLKSILEYYGLSETDAIEM